MPEGTNTHDHCIDTMLECGNVLYVLTGRYGGIYKGDNYLHHLSIHTSKFIEEVPSITFMEYLVAKNLGKNVRVYVDEKVDFARGEYIANGQQANYKSKIVDSVKVFNTLHYLNSVGDGTWYDKYSSTANLLEYIEWHYPVIL